MFMKNILKIFSIFFILAVVLFINKLDIASQPQDLLGYIQNVNSETVVLVSDNCLNTEMSSSQKENNNNFTPNSPLLQSIMPDNNTSNPLKGLMLGVGVTAVIQSSSAVTVMLVGLVNSGLMKLSQAIGVIMGSNIGTTATAWILSLAGIQSDNTWVALFKPDSLTPLLAFVGMVLFFIAKSNKNKNIGTVFLGFAVLMTGMIMMGASMSPLSHSPGFINLLTLFNNPFFGIFIGALLTAIIQSSSASVGMLQALALKVDISCAAALPIIMGQNIGTCITAIISSIGVNAGARKVAVVHLSFNIIGTAIFLTAFLVCNSFLDIQYFFNARNKHIHNIQYGIHPMEFDYMILNLFTDMDRISEHCMNVSLMILKKEYKAMQSFYVN